MARVFLIGKGEDTSSADELRAKAAAAAEQARENRIAEQVANLRRQTDALMAED